MTPDERSMIGGLFDRMRSVGAVEKDRDAEAFIAQAVRQNADAPYMLVQSVLVQEHALQQAGGRIEELERRVQELEAQAARAPQQSSGGSFLGGLFGGGGQRPAQPTSVPQAGRQSTGFGSPAPQQRPGSPWGGQQPMAGGPQPAVGGGSFMRSAMTTAAGVAGGMLLANSISGMLGGNSGAAQAANSSTAGAEPAQDANDPGGTYAAQDNNDPGGSYDQAADDGGWGGDGGDMDI